MSLNPEDYKTKLTSIRSQLPSDCQLLIVSKGRTPDEIRAYYHLGHRDFGENKIQELEEKALLLQDCPEICWHMIGHIQSNKLNQLFKVPSLFAIHSVHDRELVEKMLRAKDKLPKPVNVFLQFNTSGEEEKYGFETYTDLRSSAELLLNDPKLKFTGLMTMGTIRTENFERDAAQCFQNLNVEKEKLQSEFNLELKTSMGMSQDWEIAVRENSNWVRLGTMMFEM